MWFRFIGSISGFAECLWYGEYFCRCHPMTFTSYFLNTIKIEIPLALAIAVCKPSLNSTEYRIEGLAARVFVHPTVRSLSHQLRRHCKIYTNTYRIQCNFPILRNPYQK